MGINPAFVLHIASLVILTVFVVEVGNTTNTTNTIYLYNASHAYSSLKLSIPLQIILKLIAFRLKYFTHKFEVFDGCVVILSYVLDWASLCVMCIPVDGFTPFSVVVVRHSVRCTCHDRVWVCKICCVMFTSSMSWILLSIMSEQTRRSLWSCLACHCSATLEGCQDCQW